MTRAAHQRRTAAAVTAVVAAAALLAGCSGGSDSATSGSVIDSAAQEATDVMTSQDEQAPDGVAEAPAGDPGTASVVTSPALEDRSVIYTVDLVVEVDDIGDASDRAEAVATRFGGFVQSESTFGVVPQPLPVEPGQLEGSSDASGSVVLREGSEQAVLVLRLPADRLEQAVDELEALGETVSRNRDAQDVTDEVVDVEARVETQQASIDRLQALLGEAERINDILAIETELTQRIAELESLQARQEQLASLTQLATVTVTLVPPETLVDEGSGFMAGLEAGWSAFVRSVEVGLTALGAVLPFVLALGLLLLPLIAWLPWRRRRQLRRRQDRLPEDQPRTPTGQE